MSEGGRPPARIEVLLARNQPVAAVFRRGPTRWTLVSRWDTAADIFTDGDWFCGSFYPDRSDLSPSGRHLVYFAAFARQPQFAIGSQAWTGVSELPRLEPLAAWPQDDCWYGGGLFEDDASLAINGHPDGPTSSAPFRVRFEEVAKGLDGLYGRRLSRDGWQIEQEWVTKGVTTDTPQVRTKAGRLGVLSRFRWLERHRWYNRYELALEDGTSIHIPDVTWVDWDHSGRLVCAGEGAIYEATVDRGELGMRLIQDLDIREPPVDIDS